MVILFLIGGPIGSGVTTGSGSDPICLNSAVCVVPSFVIVIIAVLLWPVVFSEFVVPVSIVPDEFTDRVSHDTFVDMSSMVILSSAVDLKMEYDADRLFSRFTVLFVGFITICFLSPTWVNVAVVVAPSFVMVMVIVLFAPVLLNDVD